jgi:hypothetical protein
VIGTGRAADWEAVLGLGADVFLDLQADRLEEAGEVDVVFDVTGGEVLEDSSPGHQGLPRTAHYRAT